MNELKFLNNLDRNLAIAGVLGGIIIIFLLNIVATDYVDVGVTITLACIAYLIFKNKFICLSDKEKRDDSEVFIQKSGLSRLSLWNTSNISFFILFSYSIIILYFNSCGRPLSYFICIALMTVLVALEIGITSEKKSHVWLILVEIFLISISLRWSLFYMYPGVLGCDPWSLQNTIQHIVDVGVLSKDVGNYYYMPINHLAIAVTSIVTNLPFKGSMIVSIGLFEVISLAFLFFLCQNIFNTKTGLLAAMLLGISCLHIQWGWWIVPMTLGVSLIPFILYLNPKSTNSVRFKILFISILTILILTHHLTSLIVSIVLLSLYVGNKIYNTLHTDKKRSLQFSSNICLLFPVALISYWIYLSLFFDYFVRMSWGSGKMIMEANPIISSSALYIEPIWLEINKLGNLLFYGLAIIGILYIIKRENITGLRFGIILSAISISAITFLSFFFDIDPAMLAVGRWFVFLHVLLVIPASVSVLAIYNSIKVDWKKLFALGTIVFVLTSLMVLNAGSSIDSPLSQKTATDRFAFTESESQAAKTISKISNHNISIDNTYGLIFFYMVKTNLTKLMTYDDVQTKFANTTGLIVIRKYTVDNILFIQGGGGIFKLKFPYNPYTELDNRTFNRIYDVGTVTTYTNFKFEERDVR